MSTKFHSKFAKDVSTWWENQTPDSKRLYICLAISSVISVWHECFFLDDDSRLFSEKLLGGCLAGVLIGAAIFAVITTLGRRIKK